MIVDCQEYLGDDYQIMWKYIAIFAVVFGLTFYVSIQNHRDTDQPAEHGTQPANAPPPPTHDDNAQMDVKKPHRSPPDWYRFLTWPEGVTAWAIFLTLMAIAEQTQQTRKAAEAGLESAKAALLNAQAVINIDRPWITVQVEVGHQIYVRVINEGHTPAEIMVSSGKQCVLAEEASLPAIPEYPDTPTWYEGLVCPGSEPLHIFGLPIEAANSRETIEEIQAGHKRLFIMGHICYRSGLHRERPDLPTYETRWCFQYLPGFQVQDASGQPIGRPASVVRAGKRSYNEHT